MPRPRPSLLRDLPMALSLVAGAALAACAATTGPAPAPTVASPAATPSGTPSTASVAQTGSCHPDDVEGCRRACEERNDLVACVRFGRLLAAGTRVRPDPVRGAALLERACAAGLHEGCASLA